MLVQYTGHSVGIDRPPQKLHTSNMLSEIWISDASYNEHLKRLIDSIWKS